MPCVDMSLDKLREYQGRNPRPEDFDEFWDASLAEMNSIDPKAEFKPYDLPSKIADFFELTFTSTKGARIYAKFAKPKNIDGKVPAVLQFHGLSGDSGSWSSLLNFASQGFVVAFMDCRGQGGKSEDVGGTLGTTHTTQFVRGLDGDNVLYDVIDAIGNYSFNGCAQIKRITLDQVTTIGNYAFAGCK